MVLNVIQEGSVADMNLKERLFVELLEFIKQWVKINIRDCTEKPKSSSIYPYMSIPDSSIRICDSNLPNEHILDIHWYNTKTLKIYHLLCVYFGTFFNHIHSFHKKYLHGNSSN